MKRTHYLLIGLLMLVLSAVAFFACDPVGPSTIVDPATGKIYYNIVGTWIHTEGSTDYVLRLWDNGTGSYAARNNYYGRTEENEIYKINYTYEPSTCKGTATFRSPGYSDYSTYKISVAWYDENSMVISRSSSGDNWEWFGNFDRQR